MVHWDFLMDTAPQDETPGAMHTLQRYPIFLALHNEGKVSVVYMVGLERCMLTLIRRFPPGILTQRVKVAMMGLPPGSHGFSHWSSLFAFSPQSEIKLQLDLA